jgi:hypothetical protein
MWLGRVFIRYPLLLAVWMEAPRLISKVSIYSTLCFGTASLVMWLGPLTNIYSLDCVSPAAMNAVPV